MRYFPRITAFALLCAGIALAAAAAANAAANPADAADAADAAASGGIAVAFAADAAGHAANTATHAAAEADAAAGPEPAAVIVAAQERVLPALPLGPNDSATIAAIEAEGAGFPRDSVLAKYPPYEMKGATLIGTPSRVCVPVPAVQGPSVRSGQFVMGGYLEGVVHGRPVKFWWHPINSSMEMTLLLRGRLLGGGADTIRIETTDVIAPLHTDTHKPYAEEASFPSGINFPKAGTWAVVATSRRNWGCFLITAR